MTQNRRLRLLFPLTAFVLAASSFAGVATRAEADVCTRTSYFQSASGKASNFAAACDIAIANGLAAVEAAHPEAEILSYTTSGAVGLVVIDGIGPGYPQYGCSLTLRVVTQSCSPW